MDDRGTLGQMMEKCWGQKNSSSSTE